MATVSLTGAQHTELCNLLGLEGPLTAEQLASAVHAAHVERELERGIAEAEQRRVLEEAARRDDDRLWREYEQMARRPWERESS